MPSIQALYPTNFNLHDEIIGAIATPYWLKAGTSLLHHEWYINTGLYAEDYEYLDFRQAVGHWPNLQFLTDLERTHDLITQKLLVYYSLEPKPIGWNKAANSALAGFQRNLLLLRWRIQNKIESNALLTAPWYRKFFQILKNATDSTDLLDMDGRVSSIIEAFKTGRIDIPLNPRGEIDKRMVAAYLGLKSYAQITGPSKRRLVEFFEESNEKYSRYESDYANDEPGLSRNTAYDILKPWLNLWRLRDFLSHDPIGVRAFESSRDVAAAVKWARKSVTTDDAPEEMVATLVNASLEIVLRQDLFNGLMQLVLTGLDEKGFVKDRRRLSALNVQLSALGFPTLETFYQRTWKRQPREGMLDIRTFMLVMVVIACVVVILTFSARRDGELAHLRTGCIERDASGELWLNVLILKNQRRYDRIPVPKSVELAVGMLETLKEFNQEDDLLCHIGCPVTKTPAKIDFSRDLMRVCEWLGVPRLTDGSQYPFTARHFRKFFGTTYHFRWMFPNMTALSLHYRHFNPDTTRGYVRMRGAQGLRMLDAKQGKDAIARIDLERESDIVAGGRALVRYVIDQIRNGVKAIGVAGARITSAVQRLAGTFENDLDVTKGETEEGEFGYELAKLIDQTHLRVHPEGSGLCAACPGGDNRLCNCLKLKALMTGEELESFDGPDFSYAEDLGCLTCSQHVILPPLMPYWHAALSDAEGAMEYSTPEQAEILGQRIATIRRHI